MSNLSKVIYEADGSTSTFQIPFGYITKNHVRLFVNGKQMPLIWVNDSTISTYNFIPKVGDIVEIRRITPLDTKLVNFNPSAVLTDEELNVATKQNFFLLQELYENYNKVLGDIFNKAGWNNTGGTPEEIINSVAQSVLESALLAELQSNLSHISDNAWAILQNIELTNTLDSELGQAVQDIALVNTRVDNLANIYVTGTTLDAQLDALHDQIVNEVSGGTVALENYYTKVETDQNIAGMKAIIGTERESYVAGILVNYYTKVDTDTALANLEQGILSSVDQSRAIALTGYYTKAQTDSALSAMQTSLQSYTNNAIATNLTAYYTATTTDAAIAQSVSALETKLTDERAAILSNYYTAVQTDLAVSNASTSIIAQTDQNLANALTSYYTKTQTDSAIATSASSVISTTNANLAAALVDYYTKTGTDNAISTATSAVTAQVNGLTSTVQTQAQAIDGLEAQYTVKVDVNGHVSGYGLATTSNNGVPTSEFIVLADKFAIVTPGANPVVPFAVDANGVYMPNAFIRDLQVEKINGGDVMTEWNLGSTGKVVVDTGTHVKVIGNGFGANNDLIQWFGLKRPINQMTTSNSISHETIFGDAYHGGSLRAGVLANSVQSTNKTFPASATLGEFGSNGGTIEIAWSYSFLAANNNAGGWCPSSNPSAVLVLERKVGTGSWTTIHTKTITGSKQCFNEPGFSSSSERIDGSFTYTDTLQTTSDRTYRVTLNQRNVAHNQTYVQHQYISITSTEE